MKIVALAGGVGGSKLVDGLASILKPEDLTIIVNTGDDFYHYGLYIAPDLDTICYTLAGLGNPKTGWGRAGDTYNMFDSLKGLGGDTWFLLGDKDLSIHLERTKLLGNGFSLSETTQIFCQAWGVFQKVLPMSDQPVHTVVETIEFGNLPFQHYFVEKKFTPLVKGFHFEGIDTAHPSPGVLDSIRLADGIIITPSNPWVSIDPILMVPGIRSELLRKKTVAVSPIISGDSIKGPAAKIFSELGINPSAEAVYRHYSQLLTGYIFDEIDRNSISNISIPLLTTNTIMNSPQERVNLAKSVLNFLQSI